MNWEQRLREMVLAGGALAAAACADNSGAASDASPSQDPPSQDAAPPDNQPDAVGNGSTESFCCNANPDPCCAYLHCDGPMTSGCDQEISCEAQGGTWDPFAESLQDGRSVVLPGCSLSQDAAPLDAQPDAFGDGFDGSFCCNANPDPCCAYLHCGGPMTSVCNQEMSCEAEGGTWDPSTESLPDGGVIGPRCSLSQDAAPRDAAPTDTGADGHD